MTFASVLEFEEGPISRVGRNTRKGKWFRRTYSFTQANSDGGGDINTSLLNAIKAVQVTSNVIDKESSATFVVGTGVITIVNNGSTGPTAGWVEVTYLLK